MPFEPGDLPLTLTQWRSVKDPIGTQMDTTWGVYLKSRRFREPRECARKEALPGWSPVTFANSKRNKNGALTAYGIALDYEPVYDKIPKEPPPDHVVRIVKPGATPEQAAALWAPFYGLIHTSWSHERAFKKTLAAEPGPRFRVILPTARPISPEEYVFLWLWAAERAAGAGHPIDEGTKDVSRLWYVPGRAPGGSYTVLDLTGQPIDPDPICEAAREARAREQEAQQQAAAARAAEVAQARRRGVPLTGQQLGPAPVGTPSRAAYVRAAFTRAIETLRDAPMGERNRELYAQAYGMGGFLATGEGIITAAEVEGAFAAAVTVKGCNRDEIAKTIQRGLAKGAEKPRPAPMRVTGLRAPTPTPAPVVETEVVYDEGYNDPFVDVGPPTPRSPTALLEAEEPAPVAMDARAIARELRKEDWRENGMPEDDGPIDIRRLTAEIEAKAEALAEAGGGDDGEPPSGGMPEGPASPNRPSGRFVPVQVEITTLERDVADQAIEALADSDEMVFTRAGELVHIIEHRATVTENDGPTSERRERLNRRRKQASITIPPGAPIIRGLTVPGVRSLLSRVCEFGRWKFNPRTKDDEFIAAHPPIWCVSDVHSRGNWPDIRPLTAIVECPMLRADGSIIDKPGYDEFTGLFVRPTGTMPIVPEQPTIDDARESLAVLKTLVADFPFEEKHHCSGWLAALFTPFCRHAYRGVSPLFLFDANTRGVGKSKLCDIISIIVCGRPMARQTESNDEAEEKKQITSILRGGLPMVLFDNLSKPLGSGHLDSLLTGEDWSDRTFGTQNMVTVPNMCSLYATGNNVALKGDMSRRVQHVRLRSPVANPEERSDFSQEDIADYTRTNRTALMGAALTILRAYCLARAQSGFSLPKPLAPWGNFDAWSNIVRGAIVWLGEDDPADARKGLAQFADNQANALADFLEGWKKLVDTTKEGLTAADALARIQEENEERKEEGVNRFFWKKTHKHDSLIGAMGELMRVGSNGLPSPAALGYRMRSMRGRPVGDECLWGTGAQRGVMKWRVIKIANIENERAADLTAQSGSMTETLR